MTAFYVEWGHFDGGGYYVNKTQVPLKKCSQDSNNEDVTNGFFEIRPS